MPLNVWKYREKKNDAVKEFLYLRMWKKNYPNFPCFRPIWIKSIMLYVHKNVLLNLLKPTGYVMHQQFNIQQLYVLPTLYLCVLYLS